MDQALIPQHHCWRRERSTIDFDKSGVSFLTSTEEVRQCIIRTITLERLTTVRARVIGNAMPPSSDGRAYSSPESKHVAGQMSRKFKDELTDSEVGREVEILTLAE